ncbi:hypothetical protein WDU94_000103 [Cyamophila willieti]
MPSLPSPQQVAGRHLPLFEAYYKDLDPKDTNNIGALNAAKFLKNSGLSDALLSKIWDLSDPNATGFLTKPGLFTALKLVALAQNNVDVSMSNIDRDVPPPMMGDATVFPANIPTAPSPLPLASAPTPTPLISSIPVVPVDWSMTPMERLKYETLFESLQPVNGFIPGNKVKGVLMDSKLPTDTLGKIWDLADMDKDGCLDRHEFIVAMHLVYKALEKFAIPATLPPELLPPAKRKALDQQNKLNKSGPPPALPPAPLPWVVSKEDQARFETMFTKADQDQDGYVNGPEIKHVFLSANLPQPVLANIWSLTDMRQAGKLNKEQFCLALWLVQRALQGHELPTSLTPEMVPPSMRGPPGAGGVAPAPSAPQQPPPPPSNPEMDMISRDIAELSGERSNLENEIAGKQADLTIKTGEIKSLQGELDALAATLRQLENQKVEAAKRLGDLKLQTGETQSELNEVDSKIQAEQAQVDKLRTQANDQETLLSRQEKELHSKKQELDGLKHEEHELDKKQKDLQKKVNALTSGLEESTELITKVKGKVTSLETLQRNMNSLIGLTEEAVKSNSTSSIPDILLTLEPEFNTESYTSLIRDNTKQPDAFATSNGFATDPFASTGANSQSDPFAAAFNSNGPHDPFADSVADAGPVDSHFAKDPFGCDPFSAGGGTAAAASGATLGATGGGGPPPRPESPSPALPPKKSKQPPPRPAPPRPLAPTQPVASTTQEFANFDNFNTKVSSPFSTSSAYSSSSSLSPPHSTLKSPSPPSSVSTTSIIGRPSSTSQFASPLIIGRPTPGGGQASSWGANSTPGGASSNTSTLPPLTDFTDDPFKDYRYEDPFNIVDPFSDDDLPARTNPDGGSAHFDPFVESGRASAGIPATTLPSRGPGAGAGGMTQSLSHSSSFLTETDMFSNDPFFSSPAKSQSKSGRTSAPPLSNSRSLSSFTTDPFFSQSSTNGFRSDPFQSTGAATSVNNGFAGDPFSFSTNNQSSSQSKFMDSFSHTSASNKFGDDNFSSPNKFGDEDNFAGFADSFSHTNNATGAAVSNKFSDDNFNTKTGTDSLHTLFSGEQASVFTSSETKSSLSMSTKPSTKLNGGGSELPSEDEQMKWAALESLKLENEQKRKESQEKADLELAMKLSQGDSFPVNW